MKLLHTAGRLLAASLLALAAHAAQAASPEVIRIGVATAGGGDPITWGGSPGSVVRSNNALEEAFKPEGVKVEWLFFKGAGPAVNEALSNKQIDFAYQGDLPSTIGRANGLKTRILLVAGARNNLYAVVPQDSALKTLDDLKGRRVAIFRGTNGHLVADNLLASRGLSERDIKGINLDTGSAQAALISHGVDAAFGGVEYFKLRDAGLVKIIYSTQGRDPSFTRQAALLVRDDFARDHPQEVQKVVDVFVRAARWSSDEANRDALFKLWARGGIPYASWQAEFEGQSLRDRNSPLLDDFIVGRYKAVAADALKARIVRHEVPENDWFDASFLQNALKAQGLTQYWTAYDARGQAEHGATASAD